LLLPATAYAEAVRIGFGENANAFSLTLNGSAVQSDFTYDVSKGESSWRVTFTVTEDPTLGGVDRLTITGRARHEIGPHAGEGGGFFFPLTFDVHGITGPFSFSESNGVPLPHGAHLDQFMATLHIEGLNGQINRYSFHVEGRHCTPQCPELPVETETPEPTTVLLFGTGLAGVAIKMRKRLKRGNSGRGSR
jgi:hypothetical protein